MLKVSGSYCWYALYTRPRFEKKVEADLCKDGYEVYLPMLRTRRKWSDRMKWVDMPLFSGYLFVKVSCREYYQVLQHPAVMRYIAFGGTPSVVPDMQINAIRRALGEGIDFEVTSQVFRPGQPVEITGSRVALDVWSDGLDADDIFGSEVDVRLSLVVTPATGVRPAATLGFLTSDRAPPRRTGPREPLGGGTPGAWRAASVGWHQRRPDTRGTCGHLRNRWTPIRVGQAGPAATPAPDGGAGRLRRSAGRSQPEGAGRRIGEMNAWMPRRWN